MNVLAVARRRVNDPAPADEVFTSDRLGEVLRRSDFVVVAVPLTAQTKGLIGRDQLRQMKRTAHLIDISGRPAIVDQSAVIDALRAGEIGGADLQFAEPPPADSPLWAMDNLIMSQFSANSQEETNRSIALVVENLNRFRDGRPLLGLVDKAAGY
jgi:phosphoglycerate dehydrogenase-like enzyme